MKETPAFTSVALLCDKEEIGSTGATGMESFFVENTIAEIIAHSSPVECLLPRGGVLAMRPLLIHASSKVSSPHPRRVLHFEYASSLTIAPGQDIAAA